MELRQYLKYHAPLSTQFEITACLNFMRCFNTFISADVEKTLFDKTLTELHDFLRSSIESYKVEYEIRQKPKPFITLSEGISKGHSMEKRDGLSGDDMKRLNMFSMRNNGRGNNLSDFGYDHDLSDW
ncbi:MAG: hypothetical protein K6F78_04370 [Bacteroidaceae bacterium]|nr:hypothetical protein [Bacteroidaceae bacterium]